MDILDKVIEAIAIIDSCKTPTQLENCTKGMVNNKSFTSVINKIGEAEENEQLRMLLMKKIVHKENSLIMEIQNKNEEMENRRGVLH